MVGTCKVQWARAAALRCDLATGTACAVVRVTSRRRRHSRTRRRRIHETGNGRRPVRWQGVPTVRAEHGVAGFFAEGERGKWFVEHDDGPL